MTTDHRDSSLKKMPKNPDHLVMQRKITYLKKEQDVQIEKLTQEA